MTENEALNWKTKAIAYELALQQARENLKFAGNGLTAVRIIDEATNDAKEYIQTWWRSEREAKSNY